MANSVNTQSSPYVDNLIVTTDSNATPETNVLGGGATCFIFDMDNSNNTAPTYLKVWNDANPTTNSDQFDLLFLIPAQVRQTVTVTGMLANGTISDGIYLGTSLTYASTTAATLAGVSSPLNAVTVRIMAE